LYNLVECGVLLGERSTLEDADLAGPEHVADQLQYPSHPQVAAHGDIVTDKAEAAAVYLRPPLFIAFGWSFDTLTKHGLE